MPNIPSFSASEFFSNLHESAGGWRSSRSSAQIEDPIEAELNALAGLPSELEHTGLALLPDQLEDIRNAEVPEVSAQRHRHQSCLRADSAKATARA